MNDVDAARLSMLRRGARGDGSAHNGRVAENNGDDAAASPNAHALLDALPAAVYITDAEGRLTYFNQASAALWGRVPVLGEDAWCGSLRLYWPDGADMAHDECPMAVALKERRALVGHEAVAERPDGTRVSFMAYPTPLFDDQGALTGAVNMLVDVSERHEAEAAERRRSTILESVDDAIYCVDLESKRITSWNAAAQAIYGYDAREAVGQPLSLIIPPDRIEEDQALADRLRAGERVAGFETVRRRKDGSLVEVSLNVTPLLDATGASANTVRVARDITARKKTEAAMDLLLRELQHRVKNTLATAQALAAQTFHPADSAEHSVFAARLQALGRAHDLLANRNWNRASVSRIVDRALAPFADGAPEQFELEGDADLALDARAATMFAMALHELATNAVKYGALSNETGAVRITWARRDDDAGVHVECVWSERGGPPVEPPERSGFGTSLLERAFSGIGQSKLEFKPEGVTCTLAIKIAASD